MKEFSSFAEARAHSSALAKQLGKPVRIVRMGELWAVGDEQEKEPVEEAPVSEPEPREDPWERRARIMGLVRDGHLAYERLRLLLDRAHYLGFTREEVSEIEAQYEKKKPYGLSDSALIEHSKEYRE